MKRSSIFSNRIIVLLSCAVLTGGTYLHAQDVAVGVGENKTTIGDQDKPERTQSKGAIDETLKSVQILSMIFNDLLSQEFGNDFKSRGYFYDGCRGIWIPGVGVQFLLSVEFPVHALRSNETREKSPTVKKDLWEVYEDNFLNGPSKTDDSGPSNQSEASETSAPNLFLSKPVDRMKVEKLKEVILEAIVKYGHRIQGLLGDQQIMVIVSGTGSQLVNYSFSGNPYGSSGPVPTSPSVQSSPISVQSNESSHADNSGSSPSTDQSTLSTQNAPAPKPSRNENNQQISRSFSLSYGNKEGATILILQIPVRDLPSTEGSFSDIQDKVKITSYTLNIFDDRYREMNESSSTRRSRNAR